ncbi:Zinc finger protein 26 [Frankliniella fusca]|uniref:Zinc finger protein 26 n=1 Tax=Frankliniella fusca TaxID=407009 RepID=A0AAE1LXU9_9NEOP|nr:Zinc finger protein 26 [Frankliniella fusca]
MKVVLKSVSGESITVQVHAQDTVGDLKNRIQTQMGIPFDFNQLKIQGKPLTDDTLVVEYFSPASDKKTREPVSDQGRWDIPPLECAVPGCGNSKSSSPDRSFFRFPIHTANRHVLQYLQALTCRRTDLIDKAPAFLNHHYAICSDHFALDQFTNASRKVLKRKAVPSIFTWHTEDSSEFITPDVLQPDTMQINESTPVMVKMEPSDVSTSSPITLLSGDMPVVSMDVSGSVTTENMMGDIISDDEDDDDDGIDAEDEFELEDDSDIVHPGLLCRLCANSVTDPVYIFSENGKDLELAAKINICLPITVKRTDPLPKQLCVDCKSKLDEYHEFAEVCVQAEEKLRLLTKKKNFKVLKRGTKESTGVLPNAEAHVIAADQNGAEENGLKPSKALNPLKLVGSEYCCPLCVEGSMTQDVDSEPDVEFDGMHQKRELVRAFRRKARHLRNVPGLMPGMKAEDSASEEEDFDEDDDSSETTEAEGDGEGSQEADGIIAELNSTAGVYATFVGNTDELWNEDDDKSDLGTECSYPMSESENLASIPEEMEIQMQLEDGRHEVIQIERDTVCRHCGEPFPALEPALEHSKVHADVDGNPCALCDLAFESADDLLEHFKEHREEELNRRRRALNRLQCETCGRRFNKETTMEKHQCAVVAKSKEKRAFRCLQCKKAFTSEDRLLFHQQFHDGAPVNLCIPCGKMFETESALYHHSRNVHQREKPFVCETCGKRFHSNARLKTHMNFHTGDRPFPCKMCDKKFMDKDTLMSHMVVHMNVKPYQCEHCGTYCGRKHLLKKHLALFHGEQINKKRTPSLIHYECKICQETFTTSSEVVLHRTRHWVVQEGQAVDPSKVHICEYCGDVFSHGNSLGKHRREMHPDEQPYVCSICGSTAGTLYEAREHRRTHTNQEDISEPEVGKKKRRKHSLIPKLYFCDECGKGFMSERPYQKHLRSHQARQEKNLMCQVCHKKFAEKQRLLEHMQIHTGIKPYECSVCGRRFSQTSSMYTHALIHTGEKPHSCDLCGRGFRIKADRDNHRRTHTGEKPYKCEWCGQQFRTGQVYYQHRMIHTGERRFPCDVCGKAFKRSHTLVVHKRIHTGEKPNVCDICGKCFRQRSDMRKHRNLHGTTQP